MRILLTVHQFLPDHLAGTEILTLRTAQELQRRGHTVEIFTGFPAKVPLTDDQRFDRYVHDGITVHRFFHAHVPMGDQHNPVEMEYDHHLVAAAFERIAREFRPDVVHFFHLYRLSAAPIEVCRRLAIPTVFTPTDFWIICPLVQLRLPDGSLCPGPDSVSSNCVRHMAEVTQSPETAAKVRRVPRPILWLGSWAAKHRLLPGLNGRGAVQSVRALARRPAAMRTALNHIDRVLVPSRLMQRLLIKFGLQPDRATYLPYGIKADHLVRQTDKGTHTALRVGFIGTLVEHKGAHVLLQALTTLPADLPIHVHVYGRLDEFPTYISRLRQIIANEPRATLHGSFPHERMSEILAGIDILVVPSLWFENTPLIIYEAMAAGVPVAATNLGGMAEAIEPDVTGWLFPANGVAELAALLRTLAQDRPRIASASAKTRFPSTIQDYVTQLEAVYTALLPLTTP